MQPQPELRASRAEIAELHRQIEELRAVEKNFEAFVNGARDFAFITLDTNNNVTGWNRGAEAVLGYSEAEILGKSGEVFFTAEDVAKREHERELATAKATGSAEDERWHVRKDGSRFWGSGLMACLRDQAGQPCGYAKMMRDRTELRNRIEALRASEERFRLLVENVRDCALFSVALEGSISDWNPGAERIFGYSGSEILGRSFIELLAADEQASGILREDLEKAAREEGSSAEAWMKRKDGSKFYARWVTNAMHDQAGTLIGYTKVLRDETERKQRDEDRDRQFQRDRELLEGQVRFTNSALDRTKEELEDLAGQLLNAQDVERRAIARDLHDHLAQRLGLMDIKIAQLRTGVRPSLDAIQSELEQLQVEISELCEEVRNISHRLHPSTLEHLGMIPALKDLVEQHSGARSSSIRIDAANFFEEGLQPDIRSALYRICEEALRNVQRHAGDVPVTITLYRSPEAVHLEIEDRGPGFSQDAISARRTLGVISMAERARLVGGTFTLTSTPGQGTELQVAVPVHQQAYGASASDSGR